jgi:hypothetical protein
MADASAALTALQTFATQADQDLQTAKTGLATAEAAVKTAAQSVTKAKVTSLTAHAALDAMNVTTEVETALHDVEAAPAKTKIEWAAATVGALALLGAIGWLATAAFHH